MLFADKLINDPAYRDFHLEDLRQSKSTSQAANIVQLGASSAESAVQAVRLLEVLCDGIDINCGCPQDTVTSQGCGAALLSKPRWPLLENIIRSLHQNTSLPVSAKLRLCTPTHLTAELGKHLEAAGAHHLTLHARFPSVRRPIESRFKMRYCVDMGSQQAHRRRKGPAMLEHVTTLKQAVDIPILSNGNSRTFEDVHFNIKQTGADGVMSGVGLLRNPWSASFRAD